MGMKGEGQWDEGGEGRAAEKERNGITGEGGPVGGEARVGDRRGYMSKAQCKKICA